MNKRKRIKTAALAMAICTSLGIHSLGFAAPSENNASQDALKFAAQFRKAPDVTKNSAAETNQKDKVSTKAENTKEVTKVASKQPEAASQKATSKKVTPSAEYMGEYYGDSVDKSYIYKPVKDDDTTLYPETIEDYGPTFDLDCQGAPLSAVFYMIGNKSGKNIEIDGNLSGKKVYMSLKNITYKKAINSLTSTFGLNWMEDNGIIKISSEKDIMLQTRRFNVHYANKEKIASELESLNIDKEKIYANPQYGTVTVTGNSYQLSQAAKLISSIDKPVSQVVMIARLIEVNKDKDLDVGLSYNMPSYSHEASSDTAGTALHGNWLEKLTFSASASLNKTLSNGKIIAKPMIMTENGNTAEVFFGDSVPYTESNTNNSTTSITFKYEDVGSRLTITPTIDKETGIVTMKIKTEVKNIVKYVKAGDMQAPQISSRTADTIAHLRSGESFVIGGLMGSQDLDNLSGIPGLMDLPLLGKLFSWHSKSKSNSEIFITITPYIVQDGINSTSLLKNDPEYDKGKIK